MDKNDEPTPWWADIETATQAQPTVPPADPAAWVEQTENPEVGELELHPSELDPDESLQQIEEIERQAQHDYAQLAQVTVQLLDITSQSTAPETRLQQVREIAERLSLWMQSGEWPEPD